MGMDADAHLFYGVLLVDPSDGYDEPLVAPFGVGEAGDDLEWEDVAATAAGLRSPEVRPWNELTKAERYAFREYWTAKSEAAERSGIEAVRLGYCEEPVIALAIKASHLSAEWARTARPASLVIQLDWENQLAAAVAKLNLDIELAAPLWHLGAFYG